MWYTVGPIWIGGNNDEDILLASCYKNCFSVANELGVKSIAFPSISTGAYGFPLERAVRIALNETKQLLNSGTEFEEIIFVCFGDRVLNVYKEIFSEMLGELVEPLKSFWIPRSSRGMTIKFTTFGKLWGFILTEG